MQFPKKSHYNQKFIYILLCKVIIIYFKYIKIISYFALSFIMNHHSPQLSYNTIIWHIKLIAKSYRSVLIILSRQIHAICRSNSTVFLWHKQTKQETTPVRAQRQPFLPKLSKLCRRRQTKRQRESESEQESACERAAN